MCHMVVLPRQAVQDKSRAWNSENSRQHSPDSPTDSQSMADMFAKLSSQSNAFCDTSGAALSSKAGDAAPAGLGDASAELPTLANGIASFSIPDILERSGDYAGRMLVTNVSSGPEAELEMPEVDKGSLPRLGTVLMAAEDQ